MTLAAPRRRAALLIASLLLAACGTATPTPTPPAPGSTAPAPGPTAGGAGAPTQTPPAAPASPSAPALAPDATPTPTMDAPTPSATPRADPLRLHAGNALSITLLAQMGVAGQAPMLSDAAWSPDGQHIAAAGAGGVVIYDAATLPALANADDTVGSPVGTGSTAGAPTQTIALPAWVNTAAFSPSGRLLALGSVDGSAQIWRWQAAELEQLLAGSSLRVEQAAFVPGRDGRLLATLTADGKIHLWDLAAEAYLGALDTPQGGAARFALSDDGLWLAAAGHRQAQVWSLEAVCLPPAPAPLAACGDRASLPTAPMLTLAHNADITALAFAPLAGVGAPSAGVGAPSAGVGAPSAGAGAQGLAPLAAPLLATANAAGVIQLWDTATGSPLLRWDFAAAPARLLTFSPGVGAPSAGFAPLLASAHADHVVRLWDARSAATRPLAALPRHDQAVVSLAFSPDGRLLATSGREGVVRLWGVD